MLVTISRLVSSHESNWLSTSSSFRKRLWCLALLLLGCAISQPLLAQQNDRSVLVREDLKVVAASNAQVELAAEPQSSSLNAFYNTPPVSTNPFIPPRPPASMLADSDQVAKFRSSTRGTYTVSPSPDSDEQPSVLAKAAIPRPSISSASQTYASRLPNDSGLQVDKAFGSLPATPDPRFGDANNSSNSGSNTRNRFGDFGVSPAPKTENRFVALSSSDKAAASIPPAVPPVRTARAAPQLNHRKTDLHYLLNLRHLRRAIASSNPRRPVLRLRKHRSQSSNLPSQATRQYLSRSQRRPHKLPLSRYAHPV